MGILRIIAKIHCAISTPKNRIIRVLSTLDNLGVDHRLWHVFEQVNFNVVVIIDEIMKLAKIHVKSDGKELLNELATAFKQIKFKIFVNGSDEVTGFRNVTNICTNEVYIIEFHAIKSRNINTLKLSAILGHGNFENSYNIFTTLFVKAIACNEKNNQIVKFINTNMPLYKPHMFLLLKTGPNEVTFSMEDKIPLDGIVIVERAFDWWSKQEFNILNENFFFTKKTRETMGELRNIDLIASKAKEEGFHDVSIKFNFQPSEWDFSKRRQIKLKHGRELVWLGGNEILTLHDLVNIYHDFTNALSNKPIYDDFGDLIVIGNESVKSCISLVNRYGYQRSIELKRLVREWVVYCVIRKNLINAENSVMGISGIRTLNKNQIINDINAIFVDLNIPTFSIKLYKYLKSLEILGLLSYKGSGKGFTIYSFQFDFNGVNVLDIYKYSIKRLYNQILERCPSDYPSYFKIYEKSLIKCGIIKNPTNISATKHFEVIIGHDNKGYVVKRLKELSTNGTFLGNKNVKYQLLKVIYEDLKDFQNTVCTQTNRKLKDIWSQIKDRYSFLHEHKKYTNGLKTQADAFVKLVEETNNQGIPLSRHLKDLKLRKNDKGPFREFAGDTPNLGYDIINKDISPKLFSGHGKGISSFKNIFFSVVLDLACLILDDPKKIRAFYWAEEDTILDVTRLYIIIFSGEDFQLASGVARTLFDSDNGSFNVTMKLFRLLAKKIGYFLDPKQKIVSGKINHKIINIIENNVLTKENFSKLFIGVDESTLLSILTDYQRKWVSLYEYLNLDDLETTYDMLLDRLIEFLYNHYYRRLLNPDILLDQ